MKLDKVISKAIMIHVIAICIISFLAIVISLISLYVSLGG